MNVVLRTLCPIVLFGWMASLLLSLAASTASQASQDHDLPVPAYPGWILRQVDHKTDPTHKTAGALYQYVSDDPANKIVRFYENATARQAVFSSVSATYTFYTADGMMINVLSPKEGVPELNPATEHVVRTWRSMVTIIRFQSATP